MEQDKRDLERQVNELKAKCDQIEKRAAEQRQVEEKKHAEEIQFLKRTNQQLKVRVQTCCVQYFAFPKPLSPDCLDLSLLCSFMYRRTFLTLYHSVSVCAPCLASCVVILM